MKPGVALKEVYEAAQKLVQKKYPDLAQLFPKMIGFGIGSLYREEGLTINDKNETIVKEGMVFHMRVTMTGVDAKINKSTVALGDTVIIRAEGAELITKFNRRYADVSYSLHEEEEEQKKAPAAKPKPQA